MKHYCTRIQARRLAELGLSIKNPEPIGAVYGYPHEVIESTLNIRETGKPIRLLSTGELLDLLPVYIRPNEDSPHIRYDLYIDRELSMIHDTEGKPYWLISYDYTNMGGERPGESIIETSNENLAEAAADMLISLLEINIKTT